MGVFRLPAKVIDFMNKARQHCLWRGYNSQSSKQPLISWKQICKPKKFGGLGVIDLRIQNTTLLLKHLDKFLNMQDTLWVKLIRQTYYSNGRLTQLLGRRGSTWWSEVLKLWPIFWAIAKPSVGNGITVALWFDLWFSHPMEFLFPHLFSFAKVKKISLAKFCQSQDLSTHFFLPLSNEALFEFQQLQAIITRMNITTDASDLWNYIWGSTRFHPQRMYLKSFSGSQTQPIFTWLWNSRCSNKLRIFFWLLIHDRINTRDFLQRKHIIAANMDVSCSLCQDGARESSLHLFFKCNFSSSCWARIGLSWSDEVSITQLVTAGRRNNSLPFIMELIIVGSWSLWLHRNNCIFRHQHAACGSWFELFRKEILFQSHRFKPTLKVAISDWINFL
ncbi:hypothetical protein GUJ93_ZPchr0005g15381 [Zizania palustris]|uniref:Reverse transcriptase zinc-binding domain-containing protein n=1 Tax=Zizania palustris TaxID=103762 RepID=A0A8J5S308_ZIZPA|nr:hypothetical protein GUJ93_ZPchr0005g15381 [Zizania palustris]